MLGKTVVLLNKSVRGSIVRHNPHTVSNLAIRQLKGLVVQHITMLKVKKKKKSRNRIIITRNSLEEGLSIVTIQDSIPWLWITAPAFRIKYDYPNKQANKQKGHNLDTESISISNLFGEKKKLNLFSAPSWRGEHSPYTWGVCSGTASATGRIAPPLRRRARTCPPAASVPFGPLTIPTNYQQNLQKNSFFFFFFK